MKKRFYLTYLVFLFGFIYMFSQVIESEKAYVHINNVPKKEPVILKDETPPEVKLITPTLQRGEKYMSTDPEITIIGKATDESGISSVIINSELQEVSNTGVFTKALSLEEGENELNIITMDNKDNIQQSTFIFEYIPPKKTLAELVQTESKYYGLIIGIDNYKDPDVPDLDNPIRDAETLYEILLSNYTFEKENIIFLKNARREDIINTLDELAKKVTNKDNLLIFYAGHGWWDANANIGYWLPSDARRDSRANWFGNSSLVDYLRAVKSKHTLLIADACFTGSIFKTRSAFPEAQKAILKLYEMPSRKAMTSGTLTEVPDRSSFMRFLCERLAENQEKYLSSEQLFSSFRIAVINNSDAVPQYGEIRNVGDQGGDFIFIRR